MAKKCAICKQVSPTPMQKTCSYVCANEWLKSDAGIAAQERLKVAREKRAAKRERKRLKDRKDGIKTRSEWLREAQTEFNRFIRLRDHDEPCISCGTTADIQFAAGHYFSIGAAPELRFIESNVHKQCNRKCNCELSGNLLNYRIGLIKKVGEAKVDWLEGKHEPKKYTIEQIKEIKTIYKIKANELQREINRRVI